jgi:hypothetical protein
MTQTMPGGASLTTEYGELCRCVTREPFACELPERFHVVTLDLRPAEPAVSSSIGRYARRA